MYDFKRQDFFVNEIVQVKGMYVFVKHNKVDLFGCAVSLFVAFSVARPPCPRAETETDRLISLILSPWPSALLHTGGFQPACAG